MHTTAKREGFLDGPLQKDDATTTVFRSFPGELNVVRLEPIGDVVRVLMRDLECIYSERFALRWRGGRGILRIECKKRLGLVLPVKQDLGASILESTSNNKSCVVCCD